MNTEQKPQPPVPGVPSAHHREHPQTTALGQTLVSNWEKFKHGQLIGYKWMAAILIVGAIIGVSIYIFAEKAKVQTQLWTELEFANSMGSLEKFSEAHSDTLIGRIAEMDRARVLLGPEGLEKIPAAKDDNARKQAIANVETARTLMTKLIDQFKDEPVLKLECLVGMARSELAFMGIRRADVPSEVMGSSEKLVEWLDKVSEAGEGTPWGDEAKKLSASLKNDPKVKTQIISIQQYVYDIKRLPDQGGPNFPGGPLSPNNPFGGFHPNLPGMPGNSGLNPLSPISPPEMPKTDSPQAPEKKETEPAAKAPKKDAVPTPKAPAKKEAEPAPKAPAKKAAEAGPKAPVNPKPEPAPAPTPKPPTKM